MTKSIKHATAMSAILAIELYRARHDTAVALSKPLLDSSLHELRNAPFNSQQLFDKKKKIKIKESAKSNYEAQQHRFLCSQKGEHIFTALSVCQMVRPSVTLLSGAYL